MVLGKVVYRRWCFSFVADVLISLATAGVVLGRALSVGADSQSTSPADQKYLLIHAIKNSSLRDELTEAGVRGYGIEFAGNDRTGFGIILKHDDAGPRTYRFVDTMREGTFVSELNVAGSQGFRLIFAKFSGISDVGALVQQKDGKRFTYSVVSGADAGAKALTESSKRGIALAAVLGESIILEEQLGAAETLTSRQRDYRIVATIRDSTLEKELKQAAAEGFRAIAAGPSGESPIKTVVMERDVGASQTALEYKAISSASARNLEHQLQAAGAEGFRIAVSPMPKDEGLFVLHRTPSTSERFEYRMARPEKLTVNDLMLAAEADGYRPVSFTSGFLVFERPITGTPRSEDRLPTY